ncbi:MAG TPA: hypothetical protein VHX13_02570 [Acidobacteriaceae bacterium]|nr:hypothetical protein [Acidobacteriaceae bacterium]
MANPVSIFSSGGGGARLSGGSVTPPGYSDSCDHLKNFFRAVRTQQPVVEDAVFGYRAAGALAMKLVQGLVRPRGSGAVVRGGHPP